MTHAPPRPGTRLGSGKLADLDTSGSYQPALTATTTDPDLGSDGDITGRWHRVGHLVIGFVRWQFSGSGINDGSGTYFVSLPFDADTSDQVASSFLGSGATLGVGLIRDFSAATSNSRQIVPYLASASTVALGIADGSSGLAVTSSVPFTWADGDRGYIQVTYLADPSSLPSGGGGRNRPRLCRPQPRRGLPRVAACRAGWLQ